MEITGKTTINGTTAYTATTKMADNIYGKLMSVATRHAVGQEFAYLMRLLSGKEVEVSIFSGTNVSGHTSKEQILEAYSEVSQSDRKMYWQLDENGESKILAKVIDKFGDGKLGFTADVKEFPMVIDKLVKEYEIRQLKKNIDEAMHLNFTMVNKDNFIEITTFESEEEQYYRMSPTTFDERGRREDNHFADFEPITFLIEDNKDNEKVIEALRRIDVHHSRLIAFQMGLPSTGTQTDDDRKDLKAARDYLKKFIKSETNVPLPERVMPKQ